MEDHPLVDRHNRPLRGSKSMHDGNGHTNVRPPAKQLLAEGAGSWEHFRKPGQLFIRVIGFLGAALATIYIFGAILEIVMPGNVGSKFLFSTPGKVFRGVAVTGRTVVDSGADSVEQISDGVTRNDSGAAVVMPEQRQQTSEGDSSFQAPK